MRNTVDLDQLLNGTVTPEQVAQFFKDGEFYEESYLVEAIEKHLLAESDRQALFDRRLSIEKVLNGRVEGEENGAFVRDLLKRWNEKLGFAHFGF